PPRPGGERPAGASVERLYTVLFVDDAHAVATAVDDEGVARPCVYCYVDGICSHGHGAPLASPAAHVEHAHCAILIMLHHAAQAPATASLMPSAGRANRRVGNRTQR